MYHSLEWKVVRVNRTAFNSVRLNKDSFNIAEISYQTDKRHWREGLKCRCCADSTQLSFSVHCLDSVRSLKIRTHTFAIGIWIITAFSNLIKARRSSVTLAFWKNKSLHSPILQPICQKVQCRFRPGTVRLTFEFYSSTEVQCTEHGPILRVYWSHQALYTVNQAAFCSTGQVLTIYQCQVTANSTKETAT